jgi:hypothetical protein
MREEWNGMVKKSPLAPPCQRGGLLPPFGKGRWGGIFLISWKKGKIPDKPE